MKRQEIIVADEGQRASLLRFLTRLPLDKPIKVTVEEHRKKRSLSQMGLYWMWLNEVAEKIADYTGHSPEEIHEFMKHRYLTPTPITINGMTHLQYTTKKLSVQEMGAYLDQIYAFCTMELGLFVTLPEEKVRRLMLPAKRKAPRSGIDRGPQRVFRRHEAWVRRHACSVPKCIAGPIEFAHIRSAANSGTGLKPPSWEGVSLCRDHHAEQHRIGQPAFERRYGIDLAKLAAEFARSSTDKAMQDAMRQSSVGTGGIMDENSAIEQLCELTKRWTIYEDVPVSQQHECRTLGRVIYALGAEPLMREAYYTAKGLNPAASVAAAYWDGIGDWQW